MSALETPILPSARLERDPLFALYTRFDLEVMRSIEHVQKATLSRAERIWICHLSAAMRQGHLCVHYQKGIVAPSPDSLIEIGALLPDDLLKLLQEGWSVLRLPLVGEGSDHAPLIRDGDRLYFHRYWRMETEVIEAVRRLAQAAPTLVCDSKKVKERLQFALADGSIQPQQAEAIAQAADQSLCWITGGPGTGKTHTAGQLIQFLYSTLSEKKHFLHLENLVNH